MYLEHIASGQIVRRTDKLPTSDLMGALSCDLEEHCNGCFKFEVENPSIDFSISDPSATNKQNEFRIWLDQQKTLCIGGLVVISNKIKTEGYKQDGTPFKIWEVEGRDFKDLMNRKRFSIHKANITIHDLIVLILEEGGTDYGMSMDTTYIKNLDYIIARQEYIEMTASEMLDDLWNYGVSWYVDHNKKLHAWDNTITEYAFDASGYTIDDDSKLPLDDYYLGLNVGNGLVNRIKIIGKNRKSQPIYKQITGTGDPVNGLDFNLEYNPFTETFFVEEWNDLDTNEWNEIDPGGNIKTGHDGEGYIFIDTGKVVCWGGTGVIGEVALYRDNYFEYKHDGYTFSTGKINNGGMAYVAGLLDGNGCLLENIVTGFKIDNHAITHIVINGEEIATDISVPLKKIINASISNMGTNRKSFDVNPAYTPYISTNHYYFIIGDNIGVKYIKVTGKAGNTITIDEPFDSNADLTNAYLIYDPWYNFRILYKQDSLIFQIQGETYGVLGSGDWTTIYTTTETFYPPQYVFEFQIISEDLQCYFERIFTVPPESFSFTLSDGTIMSIATEEYAEAAASQCILHPQDENGSPPRLSFRGAAFIGTVADNAKNSVSKIYYNGLGNNLFYANDRIIVEGQESYIASVVEDSEIEGSGYITLDSDYYLSHAPSNGSYIYARTTLLANGVSGTLTYRREIENCWEYSDTASITLYGVIDGEPITDERLTTIDDLYAKAMAYFDSKANPRGSGTFSFYISKYNLGNNCFLSNSLNIPFIGQYFYVESSKRNINSTLVKINKVNFDMVKPSLLKCTIEFNRDDYSESIFEKKLSRKIIDLSNRKKMLFQCQKNIDSLGLTDSVTLTTYEKAIFGSFFYDTMQHNYY